MECEKHRDGDRRHDVNMTSAGARLFTHCCWRHCDNDERTTGGRIFSLTAATRNVQTYRVRSNVCDSLPQLF